jgi:hypothetical protein
MTRGNQREIDRQRAANRHAHRGGEAKGGDFLLRKVCCIFFLFTSLAENELFLQEADAKALQDKIAAKKAREEAIARGELVADEKRSTGHGGGAKKEVKKK